MKYKIKIEIERDVEADNEEEALMKFYEEEHYPQHNFQNTLDENTTITETN